MSALPDGAIKANKAVQVLCVTTAQEVNQMLQGMASIAFESHPEIDVKAYDFNVTLAAFVPKAKRATDTLPIEPIP